MHGLRSSGHRLEEEILRRAGGDVFGRPGQLGVGGLACRVDVSLAVRRGHADGGILHHAAEAAHGVSLEVGQVDHEVVVSQMLAHDVILQMFLVADGNAYLAELVHQVDGEDGVEAVFVDGLPRVPP